MTPRKLLCPAGCGRLRKIVYRDRDPSLKRGVRKMVRLKTCGRHECILARKRLRHAKASA